MADASRRSLDKVTFSSIVPSSEDVRSGAPEKRQRGLEKIAYVSSLRASPAEVEAAQGGAIDVTTSAGLAAIAAMAASRARRRVGWTEVVRTSAEALAAGGRALAQYRRQLRAKVSDRAAALVADHRDYLRTRVGSDATKQAQRDANEAVVAPPKTAPYPTVPGAEMIAPYTGPVVENTWEPAPTEDPRRSAPNLRASFADALAWARVADPARADELAAAAAAAIGLDRAELPGQVGGDWDALTDTVVSSGDETDDWTDDLVDGFEERMKVEPVGRVHLERIDMSPVGVLRGELVHSVALAPRETVTVIHREWSSRETSFEKVVSDEFEQSTEDGVTENTELAQATEVQSRHSSELNTEASVSGSYVFASASVSIGYGATSEDETSRQQSRNHAVSVTRKASARTRKEHKTTFTVKETAGVEDQVVRTLTNPSDTAPLRIDFHQMLRKWKVGLYRYGVRLTYDLVVPAPGIDLLQNIDELRRVDHQLAQAFSFPITPSAITRDTWSALGARYGAEIPPPPPAKALHHAQLAFGNPSEDEANKMRFETIELELPEGFAIARGELTAYFTLDEGGFFDVFDDPPQAVIRSPGTDNRLLGYRSGLEHLRGRSGQITVAMGLFRVRSGHTQVTVELAPTLDGFRGWQQSAWLALRRAAEEQWNAQRQELRQRREQLGAEIGAWDSLSLRKMEREEVMKTTLKWIFGPAFDLMPGEMARLYGADDGGIAMIEPSRLTPGQWAQVMGIGEFIKYVQQAIEWENVLYFVYPYFWDNPRNHRVKRFLNHPDSIHRAFLRGGAARVVLTVRPGFEESFTRLFETGALDEELAADHPYLTIAQEIRAYAAATYPGIPPSNTDPEALDELERGVRIGEWNEYTPISALDMTVNTPLDELI